MRQDSTEEYATVPVDYFDGGTSPSQKKATPSVTRKKMIVLIIAVLVILVGVGAGVGVAFSSKSDISNANNGSDVPVDPDVDPDIDPDDTTAVPTSTPHPTTSGEEWIQLGQDIDGEATGDEYGQVSNRGPCQHHTYAKLMTLFSFRLSAFQAMAKPLPLLRLNLATSRLM
jgi:hypothetical protein